MFLVVSCEGLRLSFNYLVARCEILAGCFLGQAGLIVPRCDQFAGYGLASTGNNQQRVFGCCSSGYEPIYVLEPSHGNI